MKKFLIVFLIVFFMANCSTSKDDSKDLTQLLLLSTLTKNTSINTACGYRTGAAAANLHMAGKFDVNRTLRTIDTWESTKNGSTESQRVILSFTGVASTDRIRFVYSSGTLEDIGPGYEKSTVMTCPFDYTTATKGYDTLGMTRNSSVSDIWVFNASATTPSQFTIYVGRDNFKDLTKTLKVIIENQ
ncbi:hypothetical protein EHQ24_19100 [Leptospira noumeaensis]|uniref:Lipoprotein n=1 Tax=Leptospira noumeaensis TaxID=2484964 RepID=A0A4R9HY87_9LEPT|nr:hypothetical protein [Leptospira noumeaensis]TGK77514.1 hypothetical protein EHQ24_19100 [Leptospira noumeaensis]